MAKGGYWRDEPEAECIHSECGHHCCPSKIQWEIASVETCTVMNWLGYGSHIRQARRDAYRERDRQLTALSGSAFTCITTGSKAEGLTRMYENDIDIMFVNEGVMCIEDGVNYAIPPKETTVFILNTIICYHGHCRLLLFERPGMNIHPCVYSALCDDENGHPILCSDLYVDACTPNKLSPAEIRHDRAGPSMPSSIDKATHLDKVHSLPCHCPSILHKWAERSRHWPPPDVVQKVVSLGAYVTPVGFKGGEYKHVEWRICFNTGENELVSSLNNTQVYVYVILKMVVKEVLKPVKKEITSYTVKNIVLWLAENNPQTLFKERSLFYWVCEGLGELRIAIETKHLQYYMIPDRNLMEGCGIAEEQQLTWVAKITDMINDGPNLILRLPKIRQAIISHPEPLMWYSEKRVECELLELKSYTRWLHCMDENGVVNKSDPMIKSILRRRVEILREVRWRMNWEGCRVNDLYEIWGMMLM